MSAALPHISLRRLNICFFVCLQSFILFSCIILFPPKSFFPVWMILVSFILEAFLQNQVTLGCPFILNTKIHKSDLRVYFAGLFCGVWTGLAAGEFPWQRRVVSQPFQGGTPDGILYRSFLCSHSVPPGQNPHTPAGQTMVLGCQQRQGLGGRITTIQRLSVLTSAFPLVLAPNLTPALLCAQGSYIQSLFGSTPLEKNLQPYASRQQRKERKGNHPLHV